MVLVPVKLGQQQHVGIGGRDHPHHGRDLRILPARDIPRQKSGPLARQIGIVGRNPQRIGPG